MCRAILTMMIFTSLSKKKVPINIALNTTHSATASKKDGDRQKVDHLNKLIESKDADFEYDKNGNLIKAREDKKTTRYRYDALNRLVEACEEGEFRARYSYDSFHRRTSKTIERWEHKHWKNRARGALLVSARAGSGCCRSSR